MRTADVVVIGGGVNGASTAFHLTTLGVRDVLLLERRHLAAGATGKSGALVRMHYTNDVESRLALESLKVFRDFGAIVGGEHAPVQSHHHQGFGRVGEGLRETAWADDGTLEAVEDPSKRFALGVLWHPEEADDWALFRSLVTEAAAYRDARRTA